MIRFTHVTKTYPRTGTAVHDVSLHLRKGEFAFLTGPSGAGKTTLLRMVYMEERPTVGEVQVSGTSSLEATKRDVARLRRKLGIVFQDFRLLENRTAEQNVAFALECTGAAPATIAPRVARVLGQVGLSSKGTAYPRELSGGEQQRVAIARALSNKPHLLLADEPTGNLDSHTSREIMTILKDLNERERKTIIMVTHDAPLARAYAHRTITLLDGVVVDEQREPGA